MKGKGQTTREWSKGGKGGRIEGRTEGGRGGWKGGRDIGMWKYTLLTRSY